MSHVLLSAEAAQKYLACIIVRHVLERKLTVTILPVHAFDITYNTILGTSWKYLLVGHFRNASTDNYLQSKIRAQRFFFTNNKNRFYWLIVPVAYPQFSGTENCMKLKKNIGLKGVLRAPLNPPMGTPS